MKPWGTRHPVLTWMLILLSALFILTKSPAGITIGLAGIVVATYLFGKLGSPSANRVPLTPLANRPETRIPTTVPMAKRASRNAPSAASIQRLNVLPTPARIAIVNLLDPDEEPEFVLLGSSGEAVVGTDSRLIVIPEGRNGHERAWMAPYSSMNNAQLDQQRGGARLLIGSSNRPDLTPIVRLSQLQLESGIGAVQHVRRRIAMAQQTAAETSSPEGRSAFSETAHFGIPMSGRGVSLTLGEMLEMNPTEFEEYTGRALESLGYTNVSRVGGSGDLAADLLATDPQGRSAIVQCKRYTPGSKIGSPALQAFIGMKAVHHKADRGIFVTTADYSQQAIDLAKEHGIVLIDGDDLVKIAALVLTPTGTLPEGNSEGVIQFCPDCGMKVSEGSKFCRNCGTRLPA